MKKILSILALTALFFTISQTADATVFSKQNKGQKEKKHQETKKETVKHHRDSSSSSSSSDEEEIEEEIEKSQCLGCGCNAQWAFFFKNTDQTIAPGECISWSASCLSQRGFRLCPSDNTQIIVPEPGIYLVTFTVTQFASNNPVTIPAPFGLFLCGNLIPGTTFVNSVTLPASTGLVPLSTGSIETTGNAIICICQKNASLSLCNTSTCLTAHLIASFTGGCTTGSTTTNTASITLTKIAPCPNSCPKSSQKGCSFCGTCNSCSSSCSSCSSCSGQ